MNKKIRKFNAMLLYPFMKIFNFHFSKDYRWGTTLFHRVVYRLVDTVGANWNAHRELYRNADLDIGELNLDEDFAKQYPKPNNKVAQ
jgi:hypothetical protein|tara:strand:+ start:266 stop:526 length:261 start_codon:yes stop_codon:yes gene_type:complete